MPDEPTIVRLDHPLFRGSLSLYRVPKWLRFTYSGAGISSCSRAWDALDQLGDDPRDGETVIVGRIKSQGSVHLDRVVKGRRVGSWHATADYELVDPQPDQETLRSRARWQAWVAEQEKIAEHS